MNRLLLLIFTISIFYSKDLQAKIYDPLTITFNLPAYVNKTIELGYYYGNKIYLSDSLLLDSRGSSSYTGEYHEGLYLLIMPDSSTFEFMVTGGSKYVISTTSSENYNKITLTANPIAEAYVVYTDILHRFHTETDLLMKAVNNSSDTTQLEQARFQIQSRQNLLDSITSDFLRDYGGSLPADYIKALQPVQIPDFENIEPIEKADSARWMFALNYHRDHYFDNICWNDQGLINTPVIADKIDSYLDLIIGDHPMQLAPAIDTIIRIPKDSQVRDFVIRYLFTRYKRMKYNVNAEYLYLYICRNYLLDEKASWMSDSEFINLRKEYEKLIPVSLFSKAPEINLPDKYGKLRSLYGSDSEYTVIFFWDYSCSTCRRVLDDLVKVISNYSYLDINVYTIYTGTDIEVWNAFLAKRIPDSWTNTYQTGSIHYTERYNIIHTPALFMLDTNKTIIDKDLTVPEIDSLLFRSVSKKR